jgi:tetratricopeptide (TPR) repeat protein
MAHGLNKGAYVLQLGRGNTQQGSANHGAVELLELTLEAPPDTLRVGEPRPEEEARLKRAAWALAVGEPATALSALDALASELEDPALRVRAAYLAAIACARSGQGEEASARLARLLREDASRLEVWLDDVFAYQQPELDALARAYALVVADGGGSLAEQAQALAEANKPAELALALSAAGPLSPQDALVAASCWESIGGFERASALLAPLLESQTPGPAALALGGLAAYRSGRYAQAAELWDRLAAVDPGRLISLGVKPARARRLSGR